MGADATTEDEGGGRRVEADELGPESLGTVQLLLEFAEADVWESESGAQKSEAFVLLNLLCRRGFKRVSVEGQAAGCSRTSRRSVGGLCRPVQSILEVCQGLYGTVGPQTVPSSREKARRLQPVLVLLRCEE